MKTFRIVLAFMALLPFSSAFAQMGEIIYKDFDPDPYLLLQWSYDSMYFDLNFDSIPDMYMAYYLSMHDLSFEIVSCQDSFQICESGEGDTISEDDDWRCGLWGHPNPDNLFYGGFRFMKDSNYYYGWYKTYGIPENHSWYFDKFAYCTIPNYPLRWGQTTMTGIEEDNETNSFVTLHPNPTTDYVTIKGENLRQAEAVNMLGQKVLNAQGKGNELQIDMTALPAGVYFVTVTDNEGRKCVRKVVKE